MRFCLEVSGDFACFTRPEMKSERVSYEVMTPSACRAVFESILWKPAIRWVPESIAVLRPIRWTTLRRNEVGSKISSAAVNSAMRKGSGALGMYVEEDRQQRASLLLRDVSYRITARFEMTARAGQQDSPQKFSEMFERRARKGQCINQPYLGCREFACDFSLYEDSDKKDVVDELRGDRMLGWMLYDMDFHHADSPTPRLFLAKLQDGLMRIPAPDSSEVKG